ASTVTVAGAGAVAHGSIQTPAPSSGARRRGHRSTMPPVGVAGLAPATMPAVGRVPPAGKAVRPGGGIRGLQAKRTGADRPMGDRVVALGPRRAIPWSADKGGHPR